MGPGWALSQFDMWSFCSLCKECLHRFHTPCCKKFADPRRGIPRSGHRTDSSGLDSLAPYAVRLVPVQESWDSPCTNQTAALDVAHDPLFLS